MEREHRRDTPESAGCDAAEHIAWLAAIVESSQDAIIGRTPDGTITSWNAAATAMYGYTAAEITGHSTAELIPPTGPTSSPS